LSAADYSGVTVALSVRQPWAWLIVNGFKDVENRGWHTDFRGKVLIHAGKKYGREEKEEAAMVRAEFGIAIPETLELGGIVGGVEIVDCVTESESPWFVPGGWEDGRRVVNHGFVLRNAAVLPFRPVRGMLGFFNVIGDRSVFVKEVAP